LQNVQIRTSESKDHWQLYGSGALLNPKFAIAFAGTAVTPTQIEAARRLPAGSTGQAAIFTDRIKAGHVIRKVLLRQIAIANYINPF
jgi:hypothetical protein